MCVNSVLLQWLLFNAVVAVGVNLTAIQEETTVYFLTLIFIVTH